MLRHVPRSSNSGKEISASVIADNSTVYDESGAGTATLALLEDAQEYNRWIVDFFRRYLGETNFELGAGRGTLSAIVAETHRVIPFEISEVNNALVRKRFASHSFVEPCRSDILASTDFGMVDCVYSANVLEHIEEDLVVIQHCARLLRVGGWFVAFAPAGQWLYSMFDREHGHIRRYTAADRIRLTEPSSGGAKASAARVSTRKLARRFRMVRQDACLRPHKNQQRRRRSGRSTDATHQVDGSVTPPGWAKRSDGVAAIEID